MRARLALAAFLLFGMGVAAYHSFADQAVQVTEDGTPPPPSFP
jgi:hypothetical protein